VRSGALGMLLGVLAATSVGAQGVASRLSGRVPPAVAALVERLADSAAGRGLPVEPLIEKAIEGGAKGVPDERVVTAVRATLGRLDEAATAMHTAGLARPDPEAIEAGAFALNAGLSADAVAALARHSSARYGPAATLRVAGTLVALGVPAPETVRLVQQALDAGSAPGDLLDLPQQVEGAMARGASPASAAEGLSRGAGHAPTGPHSPPGKGQAHKP